MGKIVLNNAASVGGDVVFLADITEGFKLLSENDMGESIIASPVPVDDRLFIRGNDHLFCIGKE